MTNSGHEADIIEWFEFESVNVAFAVVRDFETFLFQRVHVAVFEIQIVRHCGGG